jgi:hypothetical protein
MAAKVWYHGFWGRLSARRRAACLVMVGLAAVIAAAGHPRAAAFDLVMAGLTMLVARMLRGKRDTTFSADLALMSLAGRWLLVTVLQLVLAARGHSPLLVPDEAGYNRFAIEQSRAWLSTGATVPMLDDYLRGAFTETLSAVYTIGGRTPYAGLAVPIAFGTWTPVLTHRLVADHIPGAGRNAARIAGIVSSAFPSTLIWSILLLKDSSVTFAGMALVVGFISVPRGSSSEQDRAAVLALFGLGWLIIDRSADLVAIGLGLVLWVLWTNRGRPAWVKAAAGLIIASLMAGALLSPSVRASIDHVPVRLAVHRILGREYARTAEPPEGNPLKATWGSTAAHVPEGLLLVLLRPLPDEVRGLSQLGGALGNLLYVFLCGAAGAGTVVAWRRGWRAQALLLAGSAIALWVLLAVSEGNAGTAWRHRDAVTPFLACLAGVACAQLNYREAGRAVRNFLARGPRSRNRPRRSRAGGL